MRQYCYKEHERLISLIRIFIEQHLFSFAAVKKINVRIINRSSNPLPSYATDGSSGMDIRAQLDEPLVLEPLQRAAVPTGWPG